MDSGLTGYREALEALFARTGATSKYGLERTLGLLERLGNPHRRIVTIHVAGTNGKGSVVAMLDALLRAKGFRVGRYTSPHLIDFRERIVVDDAGVDPDFILRFLEKWGRDADAIGATFFEITTAMAFDWFAASAVDVAVIETGLGGRLDSTNVITPLVSGITSISLDHQEYLGSTETEIAREKAGILKPGIPGVIGPMRADASAAIYSVAAESGVSVVIDATTLYRVSDIVVSADGTSFTVEHGENSMNVTTGMIGEPQAANAAVALAMLSAAGAKWSVSLEEAGAVLPSVRLPGRFQTVGNCILDVAHNLDGMRSVVATLAEVRPSRPLTAIVGILKDKDWRGMLSAVATAADSVVIVSPPSAPAERAWNPHEALAFARGIGMRAEIDIDFEHAVRSAGELKNGTVLVTGSFHTVGDALRVLGEDTL